MTIVAEFKEKTYEKYFGFELARLTKVTFSPDQCDEAFLGFDDSFFLPLAFLRHRLPHMRRQRWQRMLGLALPELDQIGAEISRRLPPFRLNLFVQYKRPEFVEHFRGKEWACWKNAYFRYDITPHQQRLLANIEQQSHGRASVVYAAAAFWQNSDLYAYSRTENILNQSNIASVGRLKGHSRFSYRSAGCSGKGHSDPVDIESPPIRQIVEDGMRQETLPFNQHIKRAARQIEDALKGDEAAGQLLNLARSSILGYSEPGTVEMTSDSFGYAMATVEAFSDAFDVSFYAMG
jgi:hypothetical protein